MFPALPHRNPQDPVPCKEHARERNGRGCCFHDQVSGYALVNNGTDAHSRVYQLTIPDAGHASGITGSTNDGQHFPSETHKILFLVRNTYASEMVGRSCSDFARPAAGFLRFDPDFFAVNRFNRFDLAL